jgi:hypothetical protein
LAMRAWASHGRCSFRCTAQESLPEKVRSVTPQSSVRLGRLVRTLANRRPPSHHCLARSQWTHRNESWRSIRWRTLRIASLQQSASPRRRRRSHQRAVVGTRLRRRSAGGLTSCTSSGAGSPATNRRTGRGLKENCAGRSSAGRSEVASFVTSRNVTVIWSYCRSCFS